MQEELHCLVRGLVQGVGFRYSALHHARGLGLSGWVRNRPEGSVETRAWGESRDLDSYLSWLRKGPPGAMVQEVEIIARRQAGDSPPTPGNFEVVF